MVKDPRPGMVVIVDTAQAGTIDSVGKNVCVILANGNLWYGMESQMREPQSQEDLDACPLEVDRFEGR